MATKSISQLDTQATANETDLFEVAIVDANSASGYASKKESAAAIADAIVGEYQYPLRITGTTAKTIAGAINELKNLVDLLPQFAIEVVQTLPVSDISTTTIYLVPAQDPEQGNYYEEYIYVNNAWELVGTTAVDLSGYYTSAQVDTLLAAKADTSSLATVATSGAYADLTGKPTIDTALDTTSTNAVENRAVASEINGIKNDITVEGSASGDIASFVDGSDNPLKELKISIVATQSGSGDPSPTNVRPISGWTEAKIGYVDWNQLVYNGNFNEKASWNQYQGRYSISDNIAQIEINSGYSAGAIYQDVSVSEEQIILVIATMRKGTATSANLMLQTAISKTLSTTSNSFTEVGCIGKASQGASTLRIQLRASGTGQNTIYVKNVMCFNLTQMFGSAIAEYLLALETANTGDGVAWFKNLFNNDYYAYNTGGVELPVSNIIGTPYPSASISWQDEAGTVYGAMVDILTGVLTVTHANIASYDGETINEPWISSMDVYSAGATPTTGAQVVYPLTTPVTYQLTPTEVRSLLGVNNVWADCGVITELKYTRDLNLCINDIISRIEALENTSSSRSLSVSPTLTKSLTSELDTAEGKTEETEEETKEEAQKNER